MTAKKQPDIRAITRLVPHGGNLVQGQSELAIDPTLAETADRIISASGNHYSPAEGTDELRRAVAQKISALNGIHVDADAKPLELLITPGATGALVAIARTLLQGASALVFEPYYPYHRRIIEELGGKVETMPLEAETLALDTDRLRSLCIELKERTNFPLRAIILCTPANPTGKVFTEMETQAIADVCRELDLLCVSDEVYEHYVVGERRHISIATLEGMRERTITVNSFSKSWNISGWRLGYVYGDSSLIAPLNNANNVFYVCSPTPLQRALAEVLMANPSYYSALRERFTAKQSYATEILNSLGFGIYDSGSAFYVWARIPEGHTDAMQLNEALIREAGVAGVPGSAFTDRDDWDRYMRFCIAREDEVLESAFGRLQKALLPVRAR
jgi:aminotransferase